MILTAAKVLARVVIVVCVAVQLVLWIPAQVYLFFSTVRETAQNVIIGINMPDLPNSRQQARARWREVRKRRPGPQRVH